MPITIKVAGIEHQLATTDDLLAVENFVSETQAQALNAAEQVRLLQAQHTKLSATVKEILAGNATSTEPDPVIIIEDDSEPVYDGIIVGPDDNLQEAILDAGGQQIWLKDGEYKPFEVVGDTRIKAMSKHEAVVSGLIPWSNGWVKSGNAWFKDLDVPMYQHPAKAVHTENGSPSERGLAHRRAMQPHMLTWDGVPMQPVYNAADLAPGTFWLEGTAEKPKGIWARFPEDQVPTNQVGFSPYQNLIKGKTADVDGVVLDGLGVQYCSNTGTFGAIHMETDQEHWQLLNLSVMDSMSEGVRLKGSNHVVQSCGFSHHGHVGIAGQALFRSQLTGCTANFNVWRNGVDPLWHAGGLKWQYGCNENVIRDYEAVGNEGSGFWLDIWNVDNTIEDFELINNSTFGMHIEHNSRGTVVKNGLIKNTRTYHGGQHPNGSGLQIQGAIFDCIFSNIILEGNEDGAVYYKKSGDPRGNSGGNTFDQIAHRNNGNGNRWVIQGDINSLPDTYTNMQVPSVTNW